MRTTTLRTLYDDASVIALWDSIPFDLLEQVTTDISTYNRSDSDFFGLVLRDKIKYMYRLSHILRLYQIERNDRLFEYTIKDAKITSYSITINDNKITWAPKWIE